MLSQQVDVHNNLGDLWRAQGQLGRIEAQNCYQEALQIDPHYAPAWRGLGDLYREASDHSQAIVYYQVRRPSPPGYPHNHHPLPSWRAGVGGRALSAPQLHVLFTLQRSRTA